MDALDKLAALAVKATTTKAAERAEKWKRIQTEAPEVAEFMLTMRKEFHAKAIRVVIDGERVI